MVHKTEKGSGLLKNVLIAALFLFCSCGDQLQNQNHKPVNVIFDTDMGSDCDDVGALALLHAYADLGKAEITGTVYSSGKIPYGAGIIEAINIYYGRPEVPVGAYQKDDIGDSMDKMTAEKLVKDTSAFKNTIIKNSDTEDQTRLNRRLLNKQDDNSVTYITVGHTKGLYDLLQSAPDDISSLSGYELINKKISRWIALGALNSDNDEGHYTKDWNFFFNGTAPYTQYLVDNFPKPIFFINGGKTILTGKSLKNTSNGNIVRTAYRDWLWNVENKTLDDQRPSWDLIAVYFAVEGYGDFLAESKPGYLDFNSEKGCKWIEGDNHSNHNMVVIKKGIEDDFSDYLNEMISRKPVNILD